LPLASVPLCRLSFSSRSCGQRERSVRQKSEKAAGHWIDGGVSAVMELSFFSAVFQQFLPTE
jgi:hypothetical protein